MGERGEESDNTTVKRVREEEGGSKGRLRNGEGGGSGGVYNNSSTGVSKMISHLHRRKGCAVA